MSRPQGFTLDETRVVGWYYLPKGELRHEFTHTPMQPKTVVIDNELEIVLLKYQDLKHYGLVAARRAGGSPQLANYTESCEVKDEVVRIVVPAGSRVEYFAHKASAIRCFVPNVLVMGQPRQLNINSDGTAGLRPYMSQQF